MEPTGADLSDLLRRWREGDTKAHGALVSELYPALRALARQRLAGQRAITLSATDLAHEAYFGLLGNKSSDYRDRAHFLAVAAHAIRNLLIDHLRERGALKRGGDMVRVTLQAAEDVTDEKASHALDVLRLDELLHELERIDARAASIVELRFFGGLSIEEAAEVLGCSPMTIKRGWQFARAWLQDRLGNL